MAGFTHIYMPRAVQATDPVERMKNVVACFVGTMTLSSGNFLKPLNPILGETHQVSVAYSVQSSCGTDLCFFDGSESS